MKNQKNLTVQEVTTKYKTVEDILYDRSIYNVTRSYALRVLITKMYNCKNQKQKKKFFASLVGHTLPLTPADLNYLLEAKIFRIEFHEKGDAVNHNRKPDDWNIDKNSAGFIVSVYEIACLPDEMKKMPTQLGTLNNFIIRIFERDGEIVLSIEDGGHRSECIHQISNHAMPKANYEQGISPECNRVYNEKFAGIDPRNEDKNEAILKMLNEGILPVVFAHEGFDASARNITKPHNNNDHIAMAYKTNPLWLRMKGAVSGKNYTYREMVFDKGITNNTIAALFIASKLLGYHKSSKYQAIQFLLNKMNTHEQCEDIVSLVTAYYEIMFNNKQIVFLKKNGLYYHTYRNQAFIHSVQGTLLDHPKKTEVYRTHKKEYDALVAKGDKSVLTDNKREIKTFREWFEGTFCAYRTEKSIGVHFELARDTINFMRERSTMLVKHTYDIDAILEAHNEKQGSGHVGCEKKAMTPLEDCMGNNRWAINRPEPKLKNPVRNLNQFKKKEGVANV